jgi:Calpain family cysteine protease
MASFIRLINGLLSSSGKLIGKSRLTGSSAGPRTRTIRSQTLGVEMLENRLVPTTSIVQGGGLNGGILSILPGTPGWFQSNLSDPGIRNLAQSDFTGHGSLTRADMLGILADVEGQGAITSAELQDLKFLVANSGTLKMTDEVRFESNEVINYTANAYQNTFIGGLQVGSSPALLGELMDKWFLGMDHPVASAPYSNDMGKLYVNGGPSYLNVHQGNVGDCWLMASLAEVAAREPSVIENMITFDGQSSEFAVTPYGQIPYVQTVDVWTVRLYNKVGNPVYITVDSELPGGGTYYAQPTVNYVLGNGAMWVALVEKAYVQANGDGFVTTGNTYDNGYSDLTKGSPSWAMSAILGPSANFSIDPGSAATAWNQGILVVLCTGNTTASYDLVPNHCYAMVGFNPNALQPYQLYNPWGALASDWAPYMYNGFYVYGLFNTTGGFLTQNFAIVNQTSAAATQLQPTATPTAANLALPMDVHNTLVAHTFLPNAKDGTHLTNDALREPRDVVFGDWNLGDMLETGW